MPLSSYPAEGSLMPNSGVFFVTPELQEVLDNLPEDDPRSKLEPYRAFILRWHGQGRSYRKIQRILAAECKILVHHETLRKFVQRRSRSRKLQPELQSEPDQITPSSVVRRNRIPETPNRRSPEEIAAMREAAKSSNHKPAFQPQEETKPLFVYDPDRPLTNKPIRKD